MNGALTILPASGDEDLDWCAQLMSGSEPWITLQRSLDQCRLSVRGPGREVYIARHAELRVGFVVLCMTGAFVGYIQTICVDHDSRGSGIGTSLIAFSEERIFRESPNVFMCVSSFNSRAQELYQKLGYSVVGRLTDYIVQGHDEILLRRSRGPLTGFVPIGKH